MFAADPSTPVRLVGRKAGAMYVLQRPELQPANVAAPSQPAPEQGHAEAAAGHALKGTSSGPHGVVASEQSRLEAASNFVMQLMLNAISVPHVDLK